MGTRLKHFKENLDFLLYWGVGRKDEILDHLPSKENRTFYDIIYPSLDLEAFLQIMQMPVSLYAMFLARNYFSIGYDNRDLYTALAIATTAIFTDGVIRFHNIYTKNPERLGPGLIGQIRDLFRKLPENNNMDNNYWIDIK